MPSFNPALLARACPPHTPYTDGPHAAHPEGRPVVSLSLAHPAEKISLVHTIGA